MNLSPATARHAVLAAVTLLALADTAPAQSATATKQAPTYTRTEDVVYGRRDGLALTMDVFAPTKSNGAGVVVFVSAEYRSDRHLLALLHPLATTPFLDRGYTVFAVMHGSQPKYTVPEVVEDAHRAVRFVRHHAKKYGVDPEKLGATGGSAGGHLSLMVGCAGRPGDPNALDPVERQSSKVAAVACFFPPTDFLALEGSCTKEQAAPFDFRELDAATGKFVAVTPERRREIGREVSALTHAARGAAPTLIIHGDKDKLVPLTQSEAMVARLKDCGVTCELVVRAGRAHFGPWVAGDVPTLAGWFDAHLLGKP
ncbi:alpha/beta hydrolase [Urbifossiella limnaea]|uniref:Acetyl esterase n=1 Tax=Urbifossiella limnaea TaxID=2528023 RepID=A0A517Y1P5_9BACT|nr:alpha/beta hydrolase [Urbifossiella limnaea]QDU23686.1 acetyl esterase [Urbifossiella limnaea]